MSLNLYPIIKQLGNGGFGKTYLATNTLMPSRPYCVVKQLIPTSTDPQLQTLIQERFQQEARVLESLGEQSSGTIPKLYAYFMEEGEFYLVQEYISGQTLLDRVRGQGLFSEMQVRQMLTDILPTLTYVHSRGMVHRDIKPDNIMLREDTGKPVLIDFGAVKETMSTVTTQSGNTGRSIVIGTPGFMPAEQVSGRPMFVSDIYALGLTAVYLLTGKMPNEMEADPASGNINWQAYAPNVSPPLATVLNTSIHPIPNARYSSAQDMLQAIGGTSPGIPTGQPAPTYVAPMPADNVYQQQPTYSSPATQYVAQPSVFATPQKAAANPILPAIIGVLVGGGLIAAGLVLGKNFTEPSLTKASPVSEITATKPSSSTSANPTNNQSGTTNSGKTPVASSTQAKTNRLASSTNLEVKQIGWLRLGAVGNKSGEISVGQQLINTAQPVTISPPVVPSIGDRIKVINSVNIRASAPQPPYYKLPEQKAALPPGQELIIINTDAFVDPTSSSPFTAVWAEVGIK